MIKKCAVLMNCELVCKPRPGRNGLLGEVRHAVHRMGDFKAVPVNGERLRQPILNKNSHTISLVCLDRGAWARAIEAPAIDRLPRRDFLFNWLGDKEENLRSIVDRARQGFYAKPNHWYSRSTDQPFPPARRRRVSPQSMPVYTHHPRCCFPPSNPAD